MAQTQEGVVKAMATIRSKYGEDYWIKMGAIGGSAKVPKGFAFNRELARTAGRLGGLKSKRSKNGR